MSKRIGKLIAALLIVAAVSYVFYLNPSSAVVTYAPGGKTISMPMALILIGVFCSGAVLSALISIFGGARYQFRERRFRRIQRTQESYQSELLRGRELLAAGSYTEARALFRRLMEQKPDDVVCRILLSQTYRREGNAIEALKTLDAARAEQKNNRELLFRAAELNAVLGNHTAAYDNYALVLNGDPKNVLALERLVEEARKLGRFHEAVDFQRQLIRHGGHAQNRHQQELLAELELVQARAVHDHDGPALQTAIDEILRRHRDFPPALAALAELEKEALHFDPAAKLLTRAYKLSGRGSYLESLAQLWLEANLPDRAIAAVRAALTSKNGTPVDLRGQVFFVSLLLYLENIDEARRERERLNAAAIEDPDLRFALQVIDSALLRKEGETERAYETLLSQVFRRFQLPGHAIVARSPAGSLGYDGDRALPRLIEGPSPRLSTP